MKASTGPVGTIVNAKPWWTTNECWVGMAWVECHRRTTCPSMTHHGGLKNSTEAVGAIHHNYSLGSVSSEFVLTKRKRRNCRIFFIFDSLIGLASTIRRVPSISHTHVRSTDGLLLQHQWLLTTRVYARIYTISINKWDKNCDHEYACFTRLHYPRNL